LKGRDHVEDVGINGKITLKRISEKYSGLIWLRIGNSGGLL